MRRVGAFIDRSTATLLFYASLARPILRECVFFTLNSSDQIAFLSTDHIPQTHFLEIRRVNGSLDGTHRFALDSKKTVYATDQSVHVKVPKEWQISRLEQLFSVCFLF